MGLFEPAWLGKNEQKALAAIGKLTDVALCDLTRSAFADAQLQHEAVGRITDMALLSDAAKVAFIPATLSKNPPAAPW